MITTPRAQYRRNLQHRRPTGGRHRERSANLTPVGLPTTGNVAGPGEYGSAMTSVGATPGRGMLAVAARIAAAAGLLIGPATVSGCGAPEAEITGSTKLSYVSVTWVDDSIFFLDGGKVRRVAAGDYRDLAVAPGGGRVVAVLRDEGWFSTRWSLRVLSVK